MKILVVDYYNDKFHDQFNLIHIRALSNLGVKITLAGKKNHFILDSELNDVGFQKIPSFLFHNTDSKCLISIRSRFWDILKMLYLSLIVFRCNYDYILFLRYEIFCIPFFKTSKKVLLFDHSSATMMSALFKKTVLNHLGKNYIHLALNEIIKKHITEVLKNKQVEFIPHGLLPSFPVQDHCSFLYNNDNFIFCSATSSCDETLLLEIIESDAIQKYLDFKKIKLIVKTNLNLDNSSNVLIIKGFVNINDYQYLIQKSIAVFLPYNVNFGYRVSGVFFECVANNTPVFGSSIPSFITYSSKQPLYIIKDANDFINALDSVMENKINWNKEDMVPDQYWKSLLNI